MPAPGSLVLFIALAAGAFDPAAPPPDAPGRMRSAAFTPGGRLFVTLDRGGTVRTHDVAFRRAVGEARLVCRPAEEFDALHFTAAGRPLLTVTAVTDRYGAARVWDLFDGSRSP